MQGKVVVGLIVEELSNINVKCVKYRSRSLGQGTCQASAMRWSTMQGLVVVGLIFEEIPNINIKCVKVTGVHNIGQGHQVKVPVESVHREEVLLIDCVGVLTTRQPLRVILCHLPEKGRKEIKERVEEMKERDREKRGTGMKVKKQKK